MKKGTLMIFALLCMLHPRVYAQGRLEGLYMSAQAFRENRLSFSNANGKKCRIKLNDIFYVPFVTVITGGKATRIGKDTIFGYRDKDGVCYRFAGKQVYTILNPTEDILLYEATVLAGTKGVQTKKIYFFSKSAQASLLPLTAGHLKDVFYSDTAFAASLDTCFPNEEDMVAYDRYNKIYKLNALYKRSDQLAIKNKQK